MIILKEWYVNLKSWDRNDKSYKLTSKPKKIKNGDIVTLIVENN